ncbi:MAG: T9SS C-terminal target domain-containing protein [Bacteroidota bacterium]
MQKLYVILLILLQLFLPACQVLTPGCTDPLANNYDPSAIKNDGSCTYDPVAASPLKTIILDPALSESSGLIIWDGYIWTHNDDTDTTLYGLDPNSAGIVKEYHLEGVKNTDWEEISQDEQYIYIGDFGNNGSGNRRDLHILRIEKSSLLAGNAMIDTIWFSYSDQTDFSPQKVHMTDFDCEAMIVSNDSIYLFTKQWVSAGTSIYSLAKYPGTHKAQYKASHDIQGLVSGASYTESKQQIVLTAYTTLLDPFFYILSDFSGMDFFSGNKQRVGMSLPFYQIEGITTADGLHYYVSNELNTIDPLKKRTQSLHIFDLSPYLN